MKTITLKIYTFSELSDKAKQRAKDKYAEVFGYCWSDECMTSLKALAEHFGGKVADWEIDWFDGMRSSARFDMPELELKEIKARLKTLGSFDPKTLRGHGDCKLTGYCADESAIDGFRKLWFAGERDLNRLMQAAFQEWLKDAQADCESHYSDEGFGENSEANEWHYYDNGDLVSCRDIATA